MNIEKTKSGYTVSGLLPMSFLITDSDYQQFRDHFAKEIMEGLTDEMIFDNTYGSGGYSANEYRCFIEGTAWLRSQITGNKTKTKKDV